MAKPIDWDRISEERRGKVLWISRPQIFHALVVSSQDPTQIIRVALPKQYRICDVHYDFLRDAFGFVIESPEFPMNAVGVEFPLLDIDKIEEITIDLEKQ